MRELIDTRGIKAIKIWPFDGAAARNKNQYITPQDLDEALLPVKKLRDAFAPKSRSPLSFTHSGTSPLQSGSRTRSNPTVRCG